MLIFIALITLFPASVALLLKGKYFKLVLLLAAVNLAIAGVAYSTIIVPSSHCQAVANAAGATNGNCDDHIILYLVISTANILFSTVIWYLSFKKRSETVQADFDLSNGPLMGSQLGWQKSSERKGVHTLLTAGGWLIVLGIIFIIAAFLYALSAI